MIEDPSKKVERVLRNANNDFWNISEVDSNFHY